MTVRASILAWSTLSGVVLGLFGALLLLGAGVLVTSVVPSVRRALVRRASAVVATLLLVPPLVGAVLGYLEGTLKTR